MVVYTNNLPDLLLHLFRMSTSVESLILSSKILVNLCDMFSISQLYVVI